MSKYPVYEAFVGWSVGTASWLLTGIVVCVGFARVLGWI